MRKGCSWRLTGRPCRVSVPKSRSASNSPKRNRRRIGIERVSKVSQPSSERNGTTKLRLIKDHNLKEEHGLIVDKRTRGSSFDACILLSDACPCYVFVLDGYPKFRSRTSLKRGLASISVRGASTLNQRDSPRPMSSVRSAGHGRGDSQT